jgi:hypothetical protein
MPTVTFNNTTAPRGLNVKPEVACALEMVEYYFQKADFEPTMMTEEELEWETDINVRWFPNKSLPRHHTGWPYKGP